ncbi:hypothetical protein NPIL_501421 [Nephila pilipes]|uniref:Uncharacterized protein n=1 Tax=Nephila pilipes TaxID=299642 RepID=A0A8X6Q804_NEPPI|nr:hypothetical protein NPIL_501421 [Nephila pilipes]
MQKVCCRVIRHFSTHSTKCTPKTLSSTVMCTLYVRRKKYPKEVLETGIDYMLLQHLMLTWNSRVIVSRVDILRNSLAKNIPLSSFCCTSSLD